MADQVFSVDEIKRKAHEAAERDEGPGACRYMPGSDAERIWKDAFYVRVYQLSGEETI